MPQPRPPAIRRRALTAGALALPFIARPAHAAVTWTVFTQQLNPASTVVRGLRRMSDQVRDRTRGGLLLNIRTAGLLPIDANQVLEAVTTGRAEMGDDANYAATITPAAVMRLPLLATSPEEWDKIAAVVRPVLERALEARGMVLLAHYRSAMQLFWSRQRASGFADIARQKLRVLSLEQGEFVRQYGGVHLVTSTVEAGEALAQNKLDGTFGTAAMAGRLWKSWLKHVYLAGPNYNDAVIVVQREALERLPEGVPAILRAAADDAATWLARSQDAEEQQVMRQLSTEGLNVSLTNRAEVLEGIARVPAYWDSWVRLRGPETEPLLASIRQTLDR
jgi:TRAP-type C4-dicarboxylate transport system substrate-binding protein